MPYKDKSTKIGIIIDRKTQTKLIKLGGKGETYDNIINKLIKHYEEA